MSDSRPEPDGWELLRTLEDARARGREELKELSHQLEEKFIPGQAIAAELRELRERIDDIESAMVSRELLIAEIQRLNDHITSNTDHIQQQAEDMATRVQNIERQKQDSQQFRRTVGVALITVFCTSMSGLILAILHQVRI